MKFWFNVEGDSEYNFVINYIRRYACTFKVMNDLSCFRSEDVTKNLVYINNCESVDKIPHEINEKNHWVEGSKASAIIVVCDLESKLNCPIQRKDKILEVVMKNIAVPPVIQEKIQWIISEP